MTRVDFYTSSPDKLRTACQLSHKAMQSGVRVMLSAEAGILDALDKLLWQFPATGFLPHCRSDQAESAQMPIVLGDGQANFPDHQLLINLHDECVPVFSRFERVIEIISTDPADSGRGRERFKFYRDRGYELSHTDLTKLRT